jgi:hypothetical protein
VILDQYEAKRGITEERGGKEWIFDSSGSRSLLKNLLRFMAKKGRWVKNVR